MPAPAYATLDDLAAWVDDDLPITAPNVLRTAAYAVADRIATAMYTAVNGLPSDPTLLAALKDATCSQAAWLIANDVSVLAGNGTAGVATSVKIGTASIEYADAASSAAARAAGVDGLCPEAEKIIQRAGFSTSIVQVPWWFSRTEII